ncbi:MAG: SPASM domain-containing protein [Desulfobacterales bacterium]|nr:SPASM domain-containing protein [Desulfobacterales bacterium]
MQFIYQKIFRKLFKPRYPRLDWIQVEITSHCNGCCLYCPQHAYRKQWQPRQLSLKAFESMTPAFKKARLVYLQGWGEPFLHPGFFDMVKTAKSAGARVGTTTNGSLLSRPVANQLTTERVDIIGFSLAGITEANDRIRKGTEIDAVKQAVDDLHQAKNRHGVRSPAIHIAYMLLRSNIDEIDRLPAFFADLGVDQVVVSSLSLITRPELTSEAILAETREQWADLTEKVFHIQETAARKGVDMHFQLASPFASLKPCDENVRHALVVGADGNVSPCVMTNIPVKEETMHYFDQTPYPLPHLSFGNISDHPLNEIWHRPDYRRFRRKFATRELPAICQRCYKSRMTKIERETDTPGYGLVPDF